jgi:hypothetical protein
MSRVRAALLLLLLPIAAQSQMIGEYQWGAAYSRSSPSYSWRVPGSSGSGPQALYGQTGESATAPILFLDADVSILPTPWLSLTLDAGLRWATGPEMSEYTIGFGVLRPIKGGYLAARLLQHTPVLTTEIDNTDWTAGTKGIAVAARRGEWRVDLARFGRSTSTAFAGGSDTRAFGRTIVAARYRFLGARYERWTDDFDSEQSGSYDHKSLSRMSVYVAFGQLGR